MFCDTVTGDLRKVFRKKKLYCAVVKNVHCFSKKDIRTIMTKYFKLTTLAAAPEVSRGCYTLRFSLASKYLAITIQRLFQQP